MVTLWADVESDVRVVRLAGPREIAPLVHLFETIAAEEGWEPGDALQLWQDRSIYFALEAQGRLIGGLQLVLPDGTGKLPCQNVWPEVALTGSTHHNAHIAILALEEASRGQGILFWRLAIEMWRYCIAEGIATLFIEVTPRILPLYRRLGWPLVLQGALRRHWGEDCHLCTLGIPEVAIVLLRRAERSRLYRQIVAQAFRVTLVSLPITPPRVPKRPVVRAVRETFAAYSLR